MGQAISAVGLYLVDLVLFFSTSRSWEHGERFRPGIVVKRNHIDLPTLTLH